MILETNSIPLKLKQVSRLLFYNYFNFQRSSHGFSGKKHLKSENLPHKKCIGDDEVQDLI